VGDAGQHFNEWAASEDPEIIQQALAVPAWRSILGITLFSAFDHGYAICADAGVFQQRRPAGGDETQFACFINNVGAMLVYGITLILLAILPVFR